MEYKVKVLLAIFAFGTFSCGFLNSMVNRQNGFNTSDWKILLLICGERNSEMGFIESCPTDMTGSSRLFGFFKWLFSCDTCKSIRNNKSPWFLERFNASIQHEWPLSQPLSQEEFRWWNTRQSSGMSYKKLQTVLMQIQKLMPNKTQLFFKEKKEGQCVTCAVVGNSQNVIGSGLGKFIDCHDYVFRMNRAPVKGYEKDVGSVTTHRFNYPGSMIHIPPATGLVFLSYIAEDMSWLSNVLNITKSRENQLTSLDRDKLIIFNPLFMHYIQRSWLEGKCRYPSTGIIAAIFALHVCNKVDLFGFGMNIHKQWPHYFDKNYKGFFYSQVFYISNQSFVLRTIAHVQRVTSRGEVPSSHWTSSNQETHRLSSDSALRPIRRRVARGRNLSDLAKEKKEWSSRRE